jgi:adenosylcobalamin-dependent ribonucleoside-triphosphate reductase
LKYKPSIRSRIISRRTYNRALDSAGKTFETWEQTIDRVMRHQEWLWSRAQGKPLSDAQANEIGDLRRLMYSYKATTSGRSLWLGGTEVSKRRESTMFNCSFKRVVTVSDVVDAYWLLLQGCGVGFEPVLGCLSGFSKPVELEIIRSTKTDPNDKGFPYNIERFNHTPYPVSARNNTHWYIRVGDSAEAWAKLPGKLLANKKRCYKLTLDFSEIRPAGTRLASYGWISSGDQQIAVAMEAIVKLMNLKHSQLLSRIDILDILNWLGSTLSSRRSAEIALVPYGDLEWVDFARAKDKYYIENPQRAQSNNSLVFYFKPTKEQLSDIFELMVDCGGSEPGFINATTASKRAPWFKGTNPCGCDLASR